MRSTRLVTSLLLALVVPALTGCAALGFPEMPPTSVVPFGLPEDDPSASQDPGASPAAEPTPGSYASLDGYAMMLPAGWTAVALSPNDTTAVLGLLAATDGSLADLAEMALDRSGAQLSMLGADLVAASNGAIPPGISVVGLRTRGQPRDAARRAVEALLADIPGLDGAFDHTVVTLPAGDAHRYELQVEGDNLAVRLRMFVFRVGGDSFIVTCMAPADAFGDAEPAFDSIIRSLRFGV